MVGFNWSLFLANLVNFITQGTEDTIMGSKLVDKWLVVVYEFFKGGLVGHIEHENDSISVTKVKGTKGFVFFLA